MVVDEVKTCVDAKTGFFGAYFTVPESLREEVNSFNRETEALGESCQSASEFESKFVATGLSDRFNALLQKCIPQPRKMSSEEKKNSGKIARDILLENKEELAKDALKDVASTVFNKWESDRIQENRERMIADGTYAEHTIRKNKIDTAGRILGLFRNKFIKEDGEKD